MISNAVFLGSKQLGLSLFRTLFDHSPNVRWTIVHPDDTKDSRSVMAEFKELAEQLGIEFLLAPAATATRAILHELRPDIGFVCGWYRLLDGQTLSLVRHGLWGTHNSLLPKYRGGSPLVWAMIRGESTVGSTVFRLSEGVDEGPILLQVSAEVGRDDAISDVLKRLEQGLMTELPKKWRDLLAGDPNLQQQNDRAATYCGQRNERDGLIDWRQTAQQVHDFIRAQSSPYPCAFSYLGPKEVRFDRARPRPEEYLGTPGQVLVRKGTSIWIACGGATALEICSVSVNGKNVEPASVAGSISHRFTDRPTIWADA